MVLGARQGVESESRCRLSLDNAPVGKANAKNASEHHSRVIERYAQLVGVGMRESDLFSSRINRLTKIGQLSV